MKTLIIDPHGCDVTLETTNVHARNSLILSKYLKADLLLDDERQIDMLKTDYDNIIFSYASFYDHGSSVADRLNTRKIKYYFLVNEYNLSLCMSLSYLYKRYCRKFDVIASFSKEANTKINEDMIQAWHNVNLNALIYNKIEKEPPALFELPKKEVIYFGTYRPNRLKYFLKYFDERMTVSTSEKNVSLFKERSITADFIGKLEWSGITKRLDNYKASLYIEDEFSHNHYTYLGNRFYECLSFDVPMFFDVSCAKTIGLSGYEIDDFFFVDSKEELYAKVKDLKDFKYPKDFHDKAKVEKDETLKRIKEIVGN